MKPLFASLAVALVVGLSSPAQALIYTVAGTTTGKPTYARPLVDLSGPSAQTGVRYDSFAFTVSAPGQYSFSATTPSFNGFITLYSGSFSPATPLVNAVIANDGVFPGFGGFTGFLSNLSVGTNYELVISGINAAAFGDYSTTIGGPGNVVAVIPEPAAYGLFIAGLMLIAMRRSRGMALTDR